MTFRTDITILTLLVLLVAGCDAETTVEATEVRTLENTPTELRPVSEVETLAFDSSTVEKRDRRGNTEPDPYRFTENLPFSPLIAMDPVNGEKIQIRRETPIAEYDDRIYYFGSEANRRTFLANPEEYTKGAFARY